MPDYATFASAQATTKVWNATTGGVPSGWELPGFNDSGWSLSSVPTLSGAFDIPAGVEAVAPWTVATATTDVMLFRSTFTAPAAPYAPYLLEFFNPNSGFLVYVNGNGMLNDAGLPAILTVFVPTPGTTTVVASAAAFGTVVWSTPTGGGYEAWLAWRMTFYIPDSGGQVYSWGTVTTGVNDQGFLGTGDTATHLTPTIADPNLPPSIVKVVSNGKTTMFLTADGVIYVCGDNSTGLFGGFFTDSSAHATPVRFTSGNWGIADISIGDDCAMAIERNGDLRMWGPNAHGSFGRGDTVPGTTLTLFSAQFEQRVLIGADQDRNISAGKNFSAWRTGEEGFLLTAGENTYGQLGRAASGPDLTTRDFAGSFGLGGNPLVDRLSGGVDGLIIATDDGTVYVCGRNEFGALALTTGIGSLPGSGPSRIIDTPTAIPGFTLTPGDDSQVAQADRLSFYKRSVFTSIPWWGDGEPYGGNARGVVGVAPSSGSVIAAAGSGQFATIRIAESSGGSQNPSGALNNSHVAYAAIALEQTSETGDTFDSGVTAFGALDTLTLLTIEPIPAPSGLTVLSVVDVQFTVSSTFHLGNPTFYNVTIFSYDALGALISTDFSGFGPFSGGPLTYTVRAGIASLPPYAASMVVQVDTNSGGAGGTNTIQVQATIHTLSDPLNTGDLYTWGWGGAGQMGSGADATSNLRPVALSGMGSVLAATVCEAGMFAIAGLAAPTRRRRARAWAAVIG